MKAFICEKCGSNNFTKRKSVFTCQNCGTKYVIEEADKPTHAKKRNQKNGTSIPRTK